MVSNLQDKIQRKFNVTLSKTVNLCESEIEKIFLLKVIEYVINRQDRFCMEFIIDFIVPDFSLNGEVLPSPEANYLLADAEAILSGVRINVKHRNITLEIYPQKKVEFYDFDNSINKINYRLDFEVIKYLNGSEEKVSKKYCIECDGFEYHRTVEQIKNDNKRARLLSLLNEYEKIIRYSGTEIYHLTETDIGLLIYNL